MRADVVLRLFIVITRALTGCDWGLVPQDARPSKVTENDNDQVHHKKECGKVQTSVEVEHNRCAVDNKPITPVLQYFLSHHVSCNQTAAGREGVKKRGLAVGFSQQAAH